MSEQELKEADAQVKAYPEPMVMSLGTKILTEVNPKLVIIVAV